MGDAIELHDYWREYPPVHLILRAVHIKESPRRRSIGPSSETSSPETPLSQKETLQQILELRRTAGPAMRMQQEMPDHLKALADYADEVCAKMNAN